MVSRLVAVYAEDGVLKRFSFYEITHFFEFSVSTAA